MLSVSPLNVRQVHNLFHRTVDRIERELDDNEQAQKRSQGEQDGSESGRSSWSDCWRKA